MRMKTKWCIALENIGPYTDPVLGIRYKFLKGERATKEKVFNMIPDMTEGEYTRCFRPATEEEINGKFEWDGKQYVLKKEITMATIDYKEKYEQALECARQFIEKPYLEDSAGIVRYIFPELAESEDEKIRKGLIAIITDFESLYLQENYSLSREDVLAWLEKQSKDSPVLSNSPKNS